MGKRILLPLPVSVKRHRPVLETSSYAAQYHQRNLNQSTFRGWSKKLELESDLNSPAGSTPRLAALPAGRSRAKHLRTEQLVKNMPPKLRYTDYGLMLPMSQGN